MGLIYVQLNPNFNKNEVQNNHVAVVVSGELADDELED